MTIYSNNIIAAGLALSFFGVWGGPAANAQYSSTYWRTPNGPVKSLEIDCDRMINQGYASGFLTPLERAELSRDLDGIRITEEQYRDQRDELTAVDTARLTAKLEGLKGRISHHEHSPEPVAQTTP